MNLLKFFKQSVQKRVFMVITLIYDDNIIYINIAKFYNMIYQYPFRCINTT